MVRRRSFVRLAARVFSFGAIATVLLVLAAIAPAQGQPEHDYDELAASGIPYSELSEGFSADSVTAVRGWSFGYDDPAQPAHTNARPDAQVFAPNTPGIP